MINIFLGIFYWGVIYFGRFFDTLYLWILIIVNVISNYLTFGFKNVNVHVSNMYIISICILYFICLEHLSNIDAHILLMLMLMLVILVLNMVYIISSINLTRKESKFYLYTMYFFLVMNILYIISIIYKGFIQGGVPDFLLPYLVLLKFVLLLNNIYIPYHYLDNKYLKYTIILVSLTYFAIETYHGVLFALSPDAGSL